MTSALRVARAVFLLFLASVAGSFRFEEVADKPDVPAVVVSGSPKRNEVLASDPASFRFEDITDKAGIRAIVVSGSPKKNYIL